MCKTCYRPVLVERLVCVKDQINFLDLRRISSLSHLWTICIHVCKFKELHMRERRIIIILLNLKIAPFVYFVYISIKPRLNFYIDSLGKHWLKWSQIVLISISRICSRFHNGLWIVKTFGAELFIYKIWCFITNFFAKN